MGVQCDRTQDHAKVRRFGVSADSDALVLGATDAVLMANDEDNKDLDFASSDANQDVNYVAHGDTLSWAPQRSSTWVRFDLLSQDMPAMFSLEAMPSADASDPSHGGATTDGLQTHNLAEAVVSGHAPDAKDAHAARLHVDAWGDLDYESLHARPTWARHCNAARGVAGLQMPRTVPTSRFRPERQDTG